MAELEAKLSQEQRAAAALQSENEGLQTALRTAELDASDRADAAAKLELRTAALQEEVAALQAEKQSAATALSESEAKVAEEKEEFELVNSRFPEASAVQVPFRDTIDDRDDWWLKDAFGTFMGLQVKDDHKKEILSLDAAPPVIVESS